MSKEFRERLDRAIDLVFQEAVDGCVDCGKVPCQKHQAFGMELVIHPSKFIKIKSDGTCEFLPHSF